MGTDTSGKRDHQKLKPYIILQILQRETDDNHVMSAVEIAAESRPPSPCPRFQWLIAQNTIVQTAAGLVRNCSWFFREAACFGNRPCIR